MGCCLLHKCPVSHIMNLSWCTEQVFTQFGLVGQAVTAVTPSTAVVVLVTTLTPRREHSYLPGIKQSVCRVWFLAVFARPRRVPTQ
eukprot:5705053-Amphidinium_carterae.1